MAAPSDRLSELNYENFDRGFRCQCAHLNINEYVSSPRVKINHLLKLITALPLSCMFQIFLYSIFNFVT